MLQNNGRQPYVSKAEHVKLRSRVDRLEKWQSDHTIIIQNVPKNSTPLRALVLNIFSDGWLCCLLSLLIISNKTYSVLDTIEAL